MKEIKKERFCRIAEARVNKIISMLKLLGKCSFHGNYEYSKEQTEKIFQRLQVELDNVKNVYKAALQGISRFSYNENIYANDSGFPSVSLTLPGGANLRASVDDENYPSINIWLIDGAEERSVAFVEYNREKDKGKELCIGVCSSSSEDPYFYTSFNKE